MRDMQMKNSMTYLRILLTAALLTAISSCSEDFTFTQYPCYVVIDNSVHQDATLASAMNAVSPGIFCTISADEGRRQYSFKNNAGMKSNVNYNAVDLRTTRQVGMNNAIIVGYGTLTTEFLAYDRECPVCYDPNAVPVRSRPLTVGGDGTAQCATCKRKFDMNAGGYCITEGGVKGMNRYRCSTTGPFGVISVRNK